MLLSGHVFWKRGGVCSFQYNAAGAGYTLKWRFYNELGLVFVAIYQRILHLLYVDELLEKVMREFSNLFVSARTVYHDFDDTYRQLVKETEANSQSKRAGQLRSLENSSKGSHRQARHGQILKKGGKSARKFSESKDDGADEDGEADGIKSGSEGTDHGHVSGNKANGLVSVNDSTR